MSMKLTVFLILGVLVYLGTIIHLIKKQLLNLKYTLLWLFSGLVMFVLAVVPQISVFVADLMGVATPANAVFAIEGLFALFIILSLTSIVSTQMLRIRRLTQTQAILEKRMRELEKKVENYGKESQACMEGNDEGRD